MATWKQIVPGLVLGLVLSTGATVSAGAAPTVAGSAAPVRAVPAQVLVQRLMENRVLVLTNRHRRAHGCPALKTSLKLRTAARRHTVAMAVADTMSHQLPGEPHFAIRITRAGYTKWRRVAENVAYGFNGPREVVRAWMRSPRHRRNLLNCRLRELGVGVVLKNDTLWWTQNFGRR